MRSRTDASIPTGYQPDRAVEPQVRAIFEALKIDADVTYVNSTINFNPEQSARTQRVRLPRQSLQHGHPPYSRW